MTNYVTSENIGKGLVAAEGKLNVNVDGASVTINEEGKLVASPKLKSGGDNLIRVNEQGELVLTAADLKGALKGEEVRDLNGASKGFLLAAD